MQKFPRCWDIKTQVEFLQRKIIINSIFYYNRNTNFLSDKEFDELCRQLVSLQSQINIDDTMYGYVFYDFDGTTGFHIYGRLNDHDKNYLDNIVTHILTKARKDVTMKIHKGGKLF